MRLTRNLAAALVLAIIATLAVDTGLSLTEKVKAHFPYADTIGFFIAFALVSTYAIVYGSKWLGALLVRPDNDDDGEERADE